MVFHTRLMEIHALSVSEWFKMFDSAMTRSWYVHKWLAIFASGYRKVAIEDMITNV